MTTNIEQLITQREEIETSPVWKALMSHTWIPTLPDYLLVDLARSAIMECGLRMAGGDLSQMSEEVFIDGVIKAGKLFVESMESVYEDNDTSG